MKNKKAFSLAELSIVILVIGILFASLTQSNKLYYSSKLSSARIQTQSSAVSSITGLAIWLDATSTSSFLDSETVDGATISRWNDISPQKTSPIYFSNSSSTASDHPTYKAKCINELPCLNFNGAGGIITANTSLRIMTQYLSIFLVFTGHEGSSFTIFGGDAAAAWTATSGAFAITGSVGVNIYYSMPSNYGIQYTSANSYSKSYSRLNYIYSLVDDNSSSIFQYMNGNLANTAGQNSGILTKSLGLVQITNGNFKGNIGEIIVYTKALSRSERQDVEKYLSKKWGINLAY